MIYPTFTQAIQTAYKDISIAPLIHPDRWQGLDMSKRPEAKTYELLNYNFSVSMKDKKLHDLRLDIKPNLPWADDHFEERVCGYPINPGEQWAKWPWGNSANKFLDAHGQFNHNYMERYWPKHAGMFVNATHDGRDYEDQLTQALLDHPDKVKRLGGVREPYGDLNDIVNQLAADPTTRQAYMPVFFPEDTGAIHKGRVPCSLGYHFIQRGGYLHINYYLRSCEAYRHFKDDIYLTARLLLWVLDRLREKDDTWKHVEPGIYSMYITSFHCFVNDRALLVHP